MKDTGMIIHLHIFKGFVGLVCTLTRPFGTVSETTPSAKAKYMYTDKHLPNPFHLYSEKSRHFSISFSWGPETTASLEKEFFSTPPSLLAFEPSNFHSEF